MSKTLTLNVKSSILLLLLTIVIGIGGSMPQSFGDHTEVTIVPAIGSGASGCEDTADGCFIPSTATVDVGGIIIMTNTDTAAHTFTAGTLDGGLSGEFDTGLLMAGNSFEYTANTVGSIDYFCMVHPWMIGTIVVQGAETEEMHGSESTLSVEEKLEFAAGLEETLGHFLGFGTKSR